MCIRKTTPFCSELIQIGRLQLGRTIASEVAITKVIRKDENDVRLNSFAYET